MQPALARVSFKDLDYLISNESTYQKFYKDVLKTYKNRDKHPGAYSIVHNVIKYRALPTIKDISKRVIKCL